MIRLAHIINPVIVNESSDLHIAQSITFETLRIAQKFAQGNVNIDIYSTQFLEDRSIVPEWINVTPDLERSVLDAGTFQVERKLPLLKDILDRLYSASDADYFIYSNVDIAVLPHFYIAIKEIINKGYDAFVINRRTISNRFSSQSEISLMFAEAGVSHPGFDCFIFKRDAYTDYFLSNACIGVSLVGKVLISNMIIHATKFEVFRDLHLTFHIGNDRIWKSSSLDDYRRHNEVILNQVLEYHNYDKRFKEFSFLRRYIPTNSFKSFLLKLKDIRYSQRS